VNWIDLILTCALALFGLRGFFRGFFREVFSLIGLIGGLMLAVMLVQPVSAYAAEWWTLPPLIVKAAAFIATFFAAYFLCNLVGWLLHRSESLLFLKPLNRAGGLAVGLGKGAAIVALLVFLLLDALSGSTSKAAQEKIQGSYLISPLSRFAEGIIRLGKQEVFTRANTGVVVSTDARRL